MKRVLMFPGQGSQRVGMGKELYHRFSAARKVFEEVDDALKFSLSKIIFEGPEEKLQQTVYTQPALMAVSMAVMKVLEEKGFVPQTSVSWFAGHSLGEYSALCAAGMFSISDTARLLRTRGKAMQEAVPIAQGAMLAVLGLGINEVLEVCVEASVLGVCQIANDNSDGQVVISGEVAAINFASELAQKKGARRSILLPVTAPFHSVLMQSAAEVMKEALSQVAVKNPIIPIVSNVEATPVQDSTKIINLLIKQVTGQVRWRESMNWLKKQGVTGYYEIGSGRVLSGLVRRMCPNALTSSIDTPEMLESFMADFNN